MKKIYMILAAMTLLSMSLNAQTKKAYRPSTTTQLSAPAKGPSRASSQPVTPPYTNDFGSATLFNWWEVINANSDSRTWTRNNSGYAQYQYHSSNYADDWLVTAPLTLEAGKAYTFSIEAWCSSASYPEGIEVLLSDGHTATTLENGVVLIQPTEIASTTHTTYTKSFGVAQSGDYYIGIHAISDANMYNLYVDNFSITVLDNPPHDLSVELAAPTSVYAGETATVTARVFNSQIVPEKNYTVNITANGNVIHSETVTNALAAGDYSTVTAQYSTTQAQGGQTVNFGVQLVFSDDDATNNTATAQTAINILPPPENVAVEDGTTVVTWDAPSITASAITESFENFGVFPAFQTGGITTSVHSGAYGEWALYEPTGGYNYSLSGTSWPNANGPASFYPIAPNLAVPAWTNGAAHTGSQYMLSTVPTSGSATDHWLISPELSGEAQTITFWVREITTQYGNETFEVLTSSTDNTYSSFSIVGSTRECSSTDWTQVTVTLPAGSKYFAIRHTSKDIFGLMIDDITYIPAPEHPVSYNIYLDGQFVANVDANTFSYTFNDVSDGDHECSVSAVYNLGESVAVPATFTITSLPTPNAPTVIPTTGDANVTISITPDPATDGQLVYYVDYNGSQVQDLTFPRGAQDYTVTVHAYTEATTNYNQSPEAVVPVTIPALPQTAAPTIAISSQTDNQVTITATGNGTVTLTINGQTVEGNGSASITVPRQMQDYVVSASATAQVSGELVSETTTQNLTIPGMASSGEWTEMVGTYNNPNDLLSFQVKVGNDTTDIMLIDQFWAPTVHNDHPNGYTYVLKETIDGEEKSSNPATVPVYKTNSNLNGLYTEAQVIADNKYDENKLTAHTLNTQIEYDVVPDNNVLYYSLYRGDKNEQRPVIDVDHRISQLQKFEDKVDGNVMYYFNENHQQGVLPKYEHIGSQTAQRLDMNYVTGTGEDELSYVPVIWTFGLYTARGDGKNNSYGSDIKHSYVGKVNISVEGLKNDGDYTTGQWKDPNGTTYCVYSPIITLGGVTPDDGGANDGDTYQYVPYMYRVWCTYPNAHNFTLLANPDGKVHLADAGAIEAPFLIGQVTAENTEAWNGTGEEVKIGRALESGETQQPWSFGVPVNESSSNVQFVARFYYKKIVTPGAQVNGLRGTRDNDEAAFAIAENSDDGEGIVTGINELADIVYVVSTTYVNAQGMQSDKPFDGLNIVVTRYSDGTTRTTKLVR